MQTTTWRIAIPSILCLSLIASTCGSSNEQGYVEAQVQGDMQHVEIDRVRFDAALDEACGSGGPTAAGEGDLRRWPYLQKVTSGSAEVLFTSETHRRFRVVARTPEGEVLADVPAVPDREARPSSGLLYAAALEGLPAGSTVCYELVAEGEAFTRPTGFVTAPDPEQPSKVQLVAMGDLGKQSPDQYAVFDALREVPSQLMLITGDLAYDDGTRREIEHNFFDVYREMLGKVPVFPASGNHDYNTDGARPFRDAFALPENGGPEGLERWYSFDWGPVHVAVLDTERIEQAQLDWLDEDLAANDRPWTIAVAHRPPYSAGHHGSSLGVRDNFGPIFAAHEVPLVLTGHDHHYERTHPMDGVVYVVTGGGGRGTRPVGEEDFTAVSDRVAHFVWVEADDERMRLVAVDATGEAFDSVAFER